MVPMPNITIKNIPDGIYRRLRDSAGENHRSINSEVIACLEKMLRSARVDPASFLAEARSLRQSLGNLRLRDANLSRIKRAGCP